MYEISNIYKKNKVLAPENIFFYTFFFQLHFQVNDK